MSNIEEDINLIKLKEISERFSNGTETIEDIINYCRNYKIKFENGLKLRVVEKRYFDKLVERLKELEEENQKYIVQLTDEQYRNLVDIIRKESKKEFEQKIKDKIEENKDTAKRVAGTYQYADSGDDLEEKKSKVIELRTKAEALEELLEDK